MQIVHDLGEVFLCLVLARHVVKFDAVGGLGVALAHVEHHGGAAAARFVHQLLCHELPEDHKDRNRQDPGEQEGKQGRHLLHDLARKLRARRIQAFGSAGVVHQPGLIDRAVLAREQNAVVLDLDLVDLLVFGHGHERAVVHVFDARLLEQWRDKQVHEEQNQHHDRVVIDQRFFRSLDFIHKITSSVRRCAVFPGTV